MNLLATEKIQINERDSCLSQKNLKQYANGRLSENEKKKLENHLLECETCIAALQQVLILKDASEADATFAELFDPPKKKVSVENSQSKKNILIIAFAITGVAILSTVYFKFSKQQITDENAYSPKSEIKNPESPQFTIDKPKAFSPASTEKTNKSIPVSKENVKTNLPVEKKKAEPVTTKIKPETVLSTNILKTNVEAQKKSEIKNVFLKNEPVQKNSEAASKKPAVADLINGYKVSMVAKKSAETDYYKKELEFIFRQINQKSYKDALVEIGNFLSDNPDDVNGKYYRGYIYYLMEENDNALTDFEWLLHKKDKIFYEDASWYKSLILNRTAKFSESKKILNQLVSENTSYSSRASQLLELIGDK